MLDQTGAANRLSRAPLNQSKETDAVLLPITDARQKTEPRLLRGHRFPLRLQRWSTCHETGERRQVIPLRSAQYQPLGHQSGCRRKSLHRIYLSGQKLGAVWIISSVIAKPRHFSHSKPCDTS
ncbi:hypothetical protein [Marivita sp.]|uniref:hypothetical protein n=1 Tax=Marivita sp. TaxID=2003365 RepID=UPI0025C418C4|nr:hypothetical protein [Marivita sp.]